MSNYTNAQLIEKIARAKIRLEDSKVDHKMTCPVDSDPEYMGPCTCGADAHNSRVNKALDELKL